MPDQLRAAAGGWSSGYMPDGTAGLARALPLCHGPLGEPGARSAQVAFGGRAVWAGLGLGGQGLGERFRERGRCGGRLAGEDGFERAQVEIIEWDRGGHGCLLPGLGIWRRAVAAFARMRGPLLCN
jgi:hypothetical protein